ncbi:hypothetical protein DERP_015059 [Dermatophagoides pteronyssinus]|uniref:Uncharacterized protein n=1 Tax=Dermatophagoides pteronyssinus TaxID=6956 RepID=A0ABQ8J5S1_DERPT|nr:hypothetical protein DERP_015059 [Dermatophagoides pteronyssinus]
MISLLNEFYYECAMNPVNLIKFFINSDEEITKQKDESEVMLQWKYMTSHCFEPPMGRWNAKKIHLFISVDRLHKLHFHEFIII